MTALSEGRGKVGDLLHDLETGRRWRRYALAALAGAVANFAYAPFFFVPALSAGLVALVWLLDGASASTRPMRAAFARTWTFGFFYFLGGLYWIFSAFTMVDGAIGFAIPSVILLPAGLAGFWAIAAAIAIRFWRPGAGRIATFTVAIFAAEWVRGHVFGGFPWNLPGYVWPAGGAVSQAASVVGIYGLSLLTVLALATPAALVDRGNIGARVRPVLLAALGLGLVWGAGDQRLNRAHRGEGAAIVRVADAGFTQAEKWRRGNEARVFRAYLGLIDGPKGSHADVDIWPESAIPALLLEQPDLLESIVAALRERTLVVGAVTSEPGSSEALYFNSAVVLTGVDGAPRIGQIYNKSHLVPFGEFIPFWREIEPLADGLKLKALQQIGSGFEPGSPPSRMVIPGAPPAVILICYESIFPGLTPRGEDRPGWIINVTNDAWFGAQTGPYQHFNQARYRAIEEGLPLARAASGGVSAIVDPYGRTVASTGLRGGAAEAALPAALEPTIYARLGALAPTVVFLLALGLALALNKKQGKASP